MEPETWPAVWWTGGDGRWRPTPGRKFTGSAEMGDEPQIGPEVLLNLAVKISEKDQYRHQI